MSGAFEGRLALITGASSSLGRATALGLAREGAHLILTARRADGLKETDDALRAEGLEAATLSTLDLRDHAGIDRLGGALAARWGRLDILVSAARFAPPLSPAHHIDPRVWTQALDVNASAPWRLIRSFAPLLHQADHASAVFVTSQEERPFAAAHAASEAALHALAETWAKESNANLQVFLFERREGAAALLNLLRSQSAT